MFNILITGAGSYIGTSLEKWLSNPDFVKEFHIDTLDMKKNNWKEHNFSKYNTVFHVAGLAHADVGSITDEIKEKYYAVNTHLAVETAKKSKASGVKQFIFMSSMIIYGRIEHVTKDTKPQPANFYGDSKWQADKSIRALEDDNFKVVILRPPMIYGKGSRGNYPVLSNLASKIPFFPNVQNKRSMLYIDNLCEFVRLIIVNEERGIFFPQNKEFVSTSELVSEIAATRKHKIWITRLLTPFAAAGMYMPGKIGRLCRKAFGSCFYDNEMSIYKYEYRLFSFKQSIYLTEHKR